MPIPTNASAPVAANPTPLRFRPFPLPCVAGLAVVVLAAARFAAHAAGPQWVTGPGHRRAPIESVTPASDTGSPARPGFSEIPPTLTGILFTNRLDEERSLTNQILLNGSGVAAGDVDGDGLTDLYFCGLDSPNALYRNLGNWRFADITEPAGVGCADQASFGAALADVDGDRDLDLLVNGLARGTRLFLNDGTGRFREASVESGLAGTSGACSLAVGDLDGDGLLDVYVVNYRNDTMRDQPGITFTVGATNGIRRLLTVNGLPADHPSVAGRYHFSADGGVLENGEPDQLYRNLGHARFERVPWTEGAFLDEQGKPVTTPFDWGLSAMFRDLNRDGAPDLLVCNDFQSPDRFWLNDGHGGFRALPRIAIRQTPLFSMGADVADLDRDGWDEVFVADMLSREHERRHVQVMNAAATRQSRELGGDRPQFSRNMLFRNRGDGTYAEIAQFAGVDASDWTWCPVFLDVDLDGYEDLLASTGHWRDAQDADAAREIDQMNERRRPSPREQLRARRRFPRLDTPNFAFRNRGDLTFEETGASWGFASLRITQGMALADLDNDGDLDVVANCLNDGPLICRNNAALPRVAVRLKGAGANTRGIGARIRVRASGLPEQSQEMMAAGRYLSSDDPIRTFAAGTANPTVEVEVHWRGGRVSRAAGIPANSLCEIDEQAAEIVPPAPTATPTPLFEDRSRVLGHQHVDQPFDDFARQPLLPHSLAQPGPAVAWFDFNSDGWEDLLVGAGRGGRVAVFRNDGQGGFIPQKAQVLQTPSDRDLTGLLCWRQGPQAIALLMGLDRYELPETAPAPGLRILSLVTALAEEMAFTNTSSVGPLALADLDDDGDLDLFVGGRVIPGRYPEPASSLLLRNHQGRLAPDTQASRGLAGLGLVQGATFTDLRGDSRPELVVATEWGPIKILQAGAGGFEAWDPPIRWIGPPPPGRPVTRLSDLTGWWNSVVAGDFDGDGRLDLAAGNWGRNTARHSLLHLPIRLLYGEPEGAGTIAHLETYHDRALGAYVPLRDRNTLGAVFPSLVAAFPTYSGFGKATLDALLATGLPVRNEVNAVTLDSLVLLNRGDSLEARPLPAEAQWAPVFGITAGDFDGNGTVDLVLAQNFFPNHPAESRHDASTGTLLRGDGHGGFAAATSGEAGLRILGEGRSAAACDFDHDGRLDLAVGHNRGVTGLYRNTGAIPGLRILLEGSPENPQAIGAHVRAVLPGGKLGPLQEVRLGTGYWSQESPTALLTGTPAPEAVLIRWPSGIEERHRLASGETEFKFTQPGPPARRP